MGIYEQNGRYTFAYLPFKIQLYSATVNTRRFTTLSKTTSLPKAELPVALPPRRFAILRIAQTIPKAELPVA